MNIRRIVQVKRGDEMVRWGKILKFKMSLPKAAALAILVIVVGAIVFVYYKVSIDVIQTVTLLAVVVLSIVTFWYQTLRGPKFKINPSPIGTIELRWDQGLVVGDLPIVVSNEGAKVGTIFDIEVLEGNQISENIECHLRHMPPSISSPFLLPIAIRVGEPLRIFLLLIATDRAQIGETYRIRIRVKGSDTCETEEFDVRIPESAPNAEYGT